MDGLRLVEPRAYAEQGYPHAEWKALRALALIENPGERERFAKQPDLVPLAEEELIRYVTPVNHTIRYRMRPAAAA